MKTGALKKHDFGPNVMVVDSRAVEVLLTKIRDKNTGHKDYVYYTDRLLRILSEECLAFLPSVQPVLINTVCGPYTGLSLPAFDQLCGVSIMRSGDILLEGLRKAVPGLAIGKILIQRKEDDPEKRPKLYYSKLPPDVAKRHVILVDPMLGTGGSSVMAISELVKAGVKEENITFLNVVSCPEGIAALTKAFPRVRLVTAAVDEKLNEHKYIVPGLGDFGDRYYST